MEEKEKKRKTQIWWDLAERIGYSIVNQAVSKGLNSLGDIAKALKLDDVTTAKILGGRQNLRLSDIAKIERDLEITIIKIEDNKEKIDNIVLKLNNKPTLPLTSEENEFIDNSTIVNEILREAGTIIL